MVAAGEKRKEKKVGKSATRGEGKTTESSLVPGSPKEGGKNPM